MGIFNKLNDDIKEVDVIIAGGGTAGCVVAGRLAEADPNLSILVVEGGANNDDVLGVVHPAFFPEHLVDGSKTAIFYQAKAQPELANRARVVPSGGILGGGSSINLMLYTRAQRSDFDSWKTPGWYADDLLPFLKKLETYHGPGEEKYHGYSGPVQVSEGTYRGVDVENDFLYGCKRMGYPEIKDLQNLDANNGFQRWLRYVSKEGRRQDAAHTYLHPKMKDGKHPNLHALVESKVVRVLFDDDKKACGIEITPNPAYAGEQPTPAPRQTIRARKLVVVSSGACGSPSVLERSGIGSRDVLSRAGVPLVSDVPGVGQDYQDHHLIFYPYHTNLKPHETYDALLTGRLNRDDAIASKHKILGWNTCDVAGKVNPTNEDITAMGPEFQAVWDRDFKNAPDRPVMIMALISSYVGDPSTIPEGQYVSVANYTAYPYSRGHLHITGPEWADPLDFSVGFFTDKDDIDVKKLMWAYKKSREIMRRTKMYCGEVVNGHPQFPANSEAACLEGKPKEEISKDLKYSAEDEKAIEQFLRERVETTWHSLGTVKMAPLEERGAVDGNLNVYGVKNLKVCDLSIAPENVAANTMNTALVIGEKGADIIIKELGLQGGSNGTTGINGHH